MEVADAQGAVRRTLEHYNWAEGIVGFCKAPSENAVRLHVYLELLVMKWSAGLITKLPAVRIVAVSLGGQDMPIPGKDAIGQASEVWAQLTGGRCYIPALAINGEALPMHAEALVPAQGAHCASLA
eukprot:scaffold154702_cov27-Tisochrysis_lutea.AAC.7